MAKARDLEREVGVEWQQLPAHCVVRTLRTGLVWGMVSRKSFCIGNLKEELVLNYVKLRMRHSRRRKQLAVERSMAYLRSQSSRQMDGPNVCQTE